MSHTAVGLKVGGYSSLDGEVADTAADAIEESRGGRYLYTVVVTVKSTGERCRRGEILTGKINVGIDVDDISGGCELGSGSDPRGEGLSIGDAQRVLP